MNQIPVVVLAGGKAKPDFVAATGVENRALMTIGGRTMLTLVVEALHAAPSVGHVAVVGNLPDSSTYGRVDDQGGFVENLFAGLEAAGSSDLVLVSTCDIPFLNGAAVEDFVTRGAELRADMVYPIVPVEACYRRFPGIRRTAVRVREGRFTGGNMVLLRPAFMAAQRERIAQGYAARKSPLRLAGMLGIGTTLRCLLAFTVWPGLVSVPVLERSVSRLLGGNARALVSDYPEIATDIDRPDDVAAITAAMG